MKVLGLLTSIIFLFICIIGCLGVGFIIYGLYELFMSTIEIIMIKLEELRGGNKNE